MDTGRGDQPETTGNPAAAADAEQHVRQEIAGLRNRLSGRATRYAGPAAAAAGVLVSGWMVRRWRRKR